MLSSYWILCLIIFRHVIVSGTSITIETTTWCIRIGIAGSTDGENPLCPKDCSNPKCITSYVIDNEGGVEEAIYVEAGFRPNSKRSKQLRPKWAQSFFLPYSDNKFLDQTFTFDKSYCLRALYGWQMVGCMDKCYRENGPPVDNPWSQGEYGEDQPSTDEPRVGTGPIGYPETGGGNSCPRVIGLDKPWELQASNLNFGTDESEANPPGAIITFSSAGTTYTASENAIDPDSMEETDQGPGLTANKLAVSQYDGTSSDTDFLSVDHWRPWGKPRRSARDFIHQGKSV